MAIQVSGPVPGSGAPHLRGHTPDSTVVPTLAITLKLLVVLAMLRVLADPGWAHLEGKAPVARAVLFPLLVLAVPAFWAARGRVSPYPWVADVLVTLTCLADIVGNLLGLYDSVEWFDDAMHLVNTGTVSAVYVLLVVAPAAPLTQVTHAAIAAGLTASLAWELFEYGAFLTRSTEWTTAYSDTIGDLSLGWLGSALAVLALVAVRRHGRSHLGRSPS